MSMRNFFSMFGTHRISWIKTLIALFLIAGLPIFIWAVATQRIELRKRAATAEPTQICWNRVIFREIAVWPNSCKGSPRTDLVCTQVLVPLTQTELDGYMAWIKLGGPYIPGCGPAPTPAIPDECTSCETTGVCIEGLVCQQTVVHIGTCDSTGLCNVSESRLLCVKSDGSSNCIIKPTPTLQPGCYYQQVQCFQAPCPPILVCPTPTPVSCSPNGSSCTITNCTTPPPCTTGGPCQTGVCSIQQGICQNNRCVPTYPTTYQTPIPTPTPGNLNPPLCGQSTIPPATGPAPLSVFLHGAGSAGSGPGFDGYRWDFENDGSWDTGILADPVTHIYTQPGTYNPKYQIHGVNNVWSAVCSYPYTISVTQMPVNLTFKVKLAGVNGAEAQGATIKVKFKLQNGTVLPIDTPLVLNPVGNGVYEATATLTNPPTAGTAMRVLVKGEKHSQIVFCRQSGQTEPCNDTDYITPSSYSFDFTGRPLPPGDLNQDGKVNTADLKLITDLFNKTSTQLTPQDLKTADVDYSGTIDAFDLNLVLQTLETRYDEQ
jgi:hypothetical protein